MYMKADGIQLYRGQPPPGARPGDQVAGAVHVRYGWRDGGDRLRSADRAADGLQEAVNFAMF